MIFITGGKAQGKTEFAKSLGLPIIDNLEILIKSWLENDEDIQSNLEKLLTDENCVVVCCEIGCGIVPMDKKERIWREVTGRTACEIAKKSDSVYKIECGIAVQIK